MSEQPDYAGRFRARRTGRQPPRGPRSELAREVLRLPTAQADLGHLAVADAHAVRHELTPYSPRYWPLDVAVTVDRSR